MENGDVLKKIENVAIAKYKTEQWKTLLSKDCGIVRQNISEIFRRERELSLKNLKKIAKALNLEITLQVRFQ